MKKQFLMRWMSAMASAVLLVAYARAADEIHEGKVLAVGSSTIMVRDQRDGDDDEFVVNSDTKITMNGKPAKLTDIRAGDLARVVAVTKAEKLVAKEIAARSPE